MVCTGARLRISGGSAVSGLEMAQNSQHTSWSAGAGRPRICARTMESCFWNGLKTAEEYICEEGERSSTWFAGGDAILLRPCLLKVIGGDCYDIMVKHKVLRSESHSDPSSESRTLNKEYGESFVSMSSALTMSRVFFCEFLETELMDVSCDAFSNYKMYKIKSKTRDRLHKH